VNEEERPYLQVAFEHATEFCRELGMEGGTVSKIILAEDSSFFIQAMSLLEAVINSGLSKRLAIRKNFGSLSDEEVLTIVERMSMGGANNKVEIALACDLISDKDKRFIEGMNEVRNLYIHKFQNYALTFTELFESLPDARKKSITIKLDSVESYKKFPTFKHLKAKMLQQSARFYLLGLVHRIMEFRQPKGLLSLLGWKPDKSPTD
jgi:hypothetical protein